MTSSHSVGNPLQLQITQRMPCFFANKHDFSTEFSGKCILIRFFIFPFSQLKFMCFVGPKLSNRCKDTRRHIFGQYRSFQQYFEKRGNLLGAKLRRSISKLCVFSVRQYFSFSLQWTNVKLDTMRRIRTASGKSGKCAPYQYLPAFHVAAVPAGKNLPKYNNTFFGIHSFVFNVFSGGFDLVCIELSKGNSWNESSKSKKEGFGE